MKVVVVTPVRWTDRRITLKYSYVFAVISVFNSLLNKREFL